MNAAGLAWSRGLRAPIHRARAVTQRANVESGEGIGSKPTAKAPRIDRRPRGTGRVASSSSTAIFRRMPLSGRVHTTCCGSGVAEHGAQAPRASMNWAMVSRSHPTRDDVENGGLEIDRVQHLAQRGGSMLSSTSTDEPGTEVGGTASMPRASPARSAMPRTTSVVKRSRRCCQGLAGGDRDVVVRQAVNGNSPRSRRPRSSETTSLRDSPVPRLRRT